MPARACAIRHDGALYPHRHQYHPHGYEPVGALDAQAAAGRAARLTRGADGPSSSGGCGHLPQPRGRLACCQSRPREPWPTQGDECDRALSHGGARRPCFALRRLRAYGDRLQLLPQPALPEVSRGGRKSLAWRARGGAITGGLFPRRVHAAGSDRRHRLPKQGRGLRSPVQGFGRDRAHDRGRPQAPRRRASVSPPCCTPGARP